MSTAKVLFVTMFLFGLAMTGCSDATAPVDEAQNEVRTSLTKADKGWITKTAANGITSTGSGRAPLPGAGGRMEAIANVNVGVFENPVVTAYVENLHVGEPGNYRVEVDFSWKGSIAGNGISGAGARVEMVMFVLKRSGALITRYDIHEKEVRESFLQVGGIVVSGNKHFNVDFTLAEGQTGFLVRFMTRCEAWSGFFGALSQCHFGDYQATGHSAGWNSLSVTRLNN